MKEIIEYILASLVIISFIPVYTMITQVLYTPPSKDVSPLVLSAYSEVIKNTLYQLGKTEIVDPYVVDFRELVINKIGPSYQTYGFFVNVSSWLVSNVTVEGNVIRVYVLEPGNLSLIIIYDTLEYESIKLISYKSINNNIYVYQYIATYPNIIAVSAILETGVASCIGYWISNNVYKAYMLNDTGRLSILIPVDEPQPKNTYYPDVGAVVYAYIYYYNYGNFYQYSNLYYSYIKDIYWYNRNYIRENFNKSRIIYFGKDSGTISIDSKQYYKYDLVNYYYDQLYRRTCIRVTDNTWDCWGERTLSPAYVVIKRISFPIYNTVFIILKDSSNRIYVAQTYYNSFSFGDKIPENWPTRSISYVVRIGMIDYEIKIIVWRRSI